MPSGSYRRQVNPVVRDIPGGPPRKPSGHILNTTPARLPLNGENGKLDVPTAGELR